MVYGETDLAKPVFFYYTTRKDKCRPLLLLISTYSWVKIKNNSDNKARQLIQKFCFLLSLTLWIVERC